MRNGMLALLVTLATCSISRADEPALSIESETVTTLKELIARLDSRVTELESEVKRLKGVQQRTVLGGSLLDAMEPSTDEPPSPILVSSFQLASGSTCRGQRYRDESGVIRDAGGRPVGYWGVDTGILFSSGAPYRR